MKLRVFGWNEGTFYGFGWVPRWAWEVVSGAGASGSIRRRKAIKRGNYAKTAPLRNRRPPNFVGPPGAEEIALAMPENSGGAASVACSATRRNICSVIDWLPPSAITTLDCLQGDFPSRHSNRVHVMFNIIIYREGLWSSSSTSGIITHFAKTTERGWLSKRLFDR